MTIVMRTLLAMTLLGALALPEGGQGPVDAGPVTVSQLSLGKHWFGKRISRDDLKGRVVLFEIWGS